MDSDWDDHIDGVLATPVTQAERDFLRTPNLRPSCPFYTNGQCSAKSCEGCTAHLVTFKRRQE